MDRKLNPQSAPIFNCPREETKAQQLPSRLFLHVFITKRGSRPAPLPLFLFPSHTFHGTPGTTVQARRLRVHGAGLCHRRPPVFEGFHLVKMTYYYVKFYRCDGTISGVQVTSRGRRSGYLDQRSCREKFLTHEPPLNPAAGREGHLRGSSSPGPTSPRWRRLRAIFGPYNCLRSIKVRLGWALPSHVCTWVQRSTREW